MNKFLSIALVALVMASCQSSGNSKSMNPAPAAPSTITTSPTQITNSNATGTATNTPAAATSTNSATTALNPEHGAPGHRCDIPVGAPLQSTAGTIPAPAPAASPAPITIKPQAPSLPASNNVRLNPAHGQPGHDCNIPVGQPLKS